MKKTNKIAIVAVMLMAAVAVTVVPAAANALSFNRQSGLGDLFVLDSLFSNASDSTVLSGNGTTNLGDLFILDKLFPVQTVAATTQVSLGQQLAGRIVIQVESNGAAWYVKPDTYTRVSLGTPANAFAVMSGMAVGINNADYNSYGGVVPAKLAGKFVIKVEDHGKIYYADPVSKTFIQVVGPTGAANLIKAVGLGITNANIAKIAVAK